jgi:hypothetical protein
MDASNHCAFSEIQLFFVDIHAQMRLNPLSRDPKPPRPVSLGFVCLLRDLDLTMHSLARKGIPFAPFASVQTPASPVALQSFYARAYDPMPNVNNSPSSSNQIKLQPPLPQTLSVTDHPHNRLNYCAFTP